MAEHAEHVRPRQRWEDIHLVSVGPDAPRLHAGVRSLIKGLGHWPSNDVWVLAGGPDVIADRLIHIVYKITAEVQASARNDGSPDA